MEKRTYFKVICLFTLSCWSFEVVLLRPNASNVVLLVSTNRSQVVPLNSEVDASADVSKVIPLNGDVSKVVPLNSGVFKVVPVNSDVSEVVPLNSDFSKVVPLNSNVSKVVPLNSDVSKVVPLNRDVSKVVPLNSDVSEVVPLSTDDNEVVSQFSDVSKVLSLSTEDSSAIPLITDVSTSVPLSSDVSKVIPLNSDSSDGVPPITDDMEFVPLNNDFSKEPLSGVSEVVPISTDDSEVVLLISDVSNVVSLSSDNSIVTPLSTVTSKIVPLSTDMSEMASKSMKVSEAEVSQSESEFSISNGETERRTEDIRSGATTESTLETSPYLCSVQSLCQDFSTDDSTHVVMQRRPCSCDSRCYFFGDCCDQMDSSNRNSEEKISCRHLPPPHNTHTAFMMTKCPSNSSTSLQEKCSGMVSEENYSAELDIPVGSEDGILYRNVFCARCNNALKLESVKASLECQNQYNTTSWTFLRQMTYESERFTWTSTNNVCHMNIYFREKHLRWCPEMVVKNCSSSWIPRNKIQTKITKNCLSRTFYVEANQVYYRNPSCALCNYVEATDGRCLSPITIAEPSSKANIKHLSSPNCSEHEVWSRVDNVCENVFCVANYSCRDSQQRSALNSSCERKVHKQSQAVLYFDGTVYLNETKKYHSFGQYELLPDGSVEICKPFGKWSKTMQILSDVLITISLTCLALHMIIFCYLPKRRNIPSMTLFSLAFSLFMTDLIFLCFFRYNKYSFLCLAFAALLYYFLSAAFLWMNVMSIDIFRTFRSNMYKMKSKRVFVQYSIYAWVVPFFSTTSVVLVDQLAPNGFYFSPGLASDNCWFNNMWGHAVFFTIPAGIIVLVNMILYGFSVYAIYKQHKTAILAARSVQPGEKHKTQDKTLPKATEEVQRYSQSSAIEKSLSDKVKNYRIFAHTELRVRLALYSKLALIMGMTWIFAFMSLHTESYFLEYLFIVFNGLQGTLIFVAFDCKRKVWRDIRNRFSCSVTRSTKGSSREVNYTNATYLITEKTFAGRKATLHINDNKLNTINETYL